MFCSTNAAVTSVHGYLKECPGTSDSKGDPWPVRTNHQSAEGTGWMMELRVVSTIRMARKERVNGGRLMRAMAVEVVYGGSDMEEMRSSGSTSHELQGQFPLRASILVSLVWK
jgi:hypothetical protein